MLLLSLVLVTIFGVITVYIATAIINFLMFAGALVIDLIIIVTDFLALMLFIFVCKKIYRAVKKNR